MNKNIARDILTRLIAATPHISYTDSSRTPGKKVRDGRAADGSHDHIFTSAVIGNRKVGISWEDGQIDGNWVVSFGKTNGGHKFAKGGTINERRFDDEVGAILHFVTEAWPAAVTLSKM